MHTTPLGQRADGAHGAVYNLVEIEIVMTGDLLSRIGPREEKEVLHDLGESPCCPLHHRHRLAILRLGAMLPRERNLRLGAENRGRGAQLMRRVGHKATLQRKGPFEAIEERIDDGGEPAEFIVRACDRQAFVEVGVGDGRGLCPHRRDRGERTAGHEEAAARRRRQ